MMTSSRYVELREFITKNPSRTSFSSLKEKRDEKVTNEV